MIDQVLGHNNIPDIQLVANQQHLNRRRKCALPTTSNNVATPTPNITRPSTITTTQSQSHQNRYAFSNQLSLNQLHYPASNTTSLPSNAPAPLNSYSNIHSQPNNYNHHNHNPNNVNTSAAIAAANLLQQRVLPPASGNPPKRHRLLATPNSNTNPAPTAVPSSAAPLKACNTNNFSHSSINSASMSAVPTNAGKPSPPSVMASLTFPMPHDNSTARFPFSQSLPIAQLSTNANGAVGAPPPPPPPPGEKKNPMPNQHPHLQQQHQQQPPSHPTPPHHAAAQFRFPFPLMPHNQRPPAPHPLYIPEKHTPAYEYALERGVDLRAPSTLDTTTLPSLDATPNPTSANTSTINPTPTIARRASSGSGSGSGRAKLTCPHETCGKEYTRSHALNVHISTKHTGTSQEYQCTRCGKKFNRKDTLKRHFATTHQMLRNWPCKQCPRRFGQQAHLNTHVRTVHGKDRPYKCDQCPKSFGTLYNLNAHKNTHRRIQKQYACDVCKKTYKIKSSLARHKRKEKHLSPHELAALENSSPSPSPNHHVVVPGPAVEHATQELPLRSVQVVDALSPMTAEYAPPTRIEPNR